MTAPSPELLAAARVELARRGISPWAELGESLEQELGHVPTALDGVDLKTQLGQLDGRQRAVLRRFLTTLMDSPEE